MVRKLTDSKVKNATCKADGKPLNLSDGGGLYLHVKAGNKKVWWYNYRMDGKTKTLTITEVSHVRPCVQRAVVDMGIKVGLHCVVFVTG